MAERLVLDLFCEDSGHEVFITNLVRVIARSLAVTEPLVKPISARGGHGKAISELKAWQRGLRSGSLVRGDALLVVIDANSKGWRAMDRDVRAAIDSSLYPQVLIGCPDPHVEVWSAADPAAFQSQFSVTVPPAPSRGGRLVYKQWLRIALEQAGVVVLGDPMDISLDLLPAMDLNRACRNDDSLQHLISSVRAWLQRQK
jgi:hypothetical protein